mmetsp:Transcript_66857/g.189757  ORF Transcript_66857/g.189757 Transcript_66857/m.189757 type:complete len:243 (-) Transcript_66857:478-1206(-)
MPCVMSNSVPSYRSLRKAKTSLRPRGCSAATVTGRSSGSTGSFRLPQPLGAVRPRSRHCLSEPYRGIGASPAGDWKVTVSGAKTRVKSSGSWPSQSPAARATSLMLAEKSQSSLGCSGTSRSTKLLATKPAWPCGRRIAAQEDFETPWTPPTTWKIHASPVRSASVTASPPSAKATLPSASKPKLHSPTMGKKPYSSAILPMVMTPHLAVSQRSRAICIMFVRSRRPSVAGFPDRGSPAAGA